MSHGPCARAGVVVLFLLLPPFAYGDQAPPQAEPPPVTQTATATLSQTPASANAAAAGGSCPYCNLRGADLSGRDLSDANFTGADLTGANLRNARLHGTMLLAANLTDAHLDGADLTKGPERAAANLADANLTNATFTNAKLGGADFQYARISGADFTGTDMREAHFGPRLEFAAGRSPVLKDASVPCSLTQQYSGLDLQGARVEPCAPRENKYYCGAFDPSKLTAVIYVAASGTDSGTCGAALASPCKTIGQGIANCNAANCTVLVAYDRYALGATIAVRNGVSVYGGCVSMPAPDPASVSLVTAPPNGVPAFSATGLTSATTVQGFAVLGTPGMSSTTASVTVKASGNSALALNYLTIAAANGATPPAGGDGTAGNGGGKAGTPPDAGTNGSCSDANGGKGGTQSSWLTNGHCCAFLCFKYCATCNTSYVPSSSGSAGSTGTWASGGGVGNSVCYGCPDKERPSNGGGGNPGGAGTCPAQATPSPDTAGSISGGAWTPSVSSTGGNGGSGGGGGGGGAGGGCNYITCFANLQSYNGIAGGGGGAGGCGGTGGKGGTQGGASFALLVTGGTVTVANSIITGATGGKGGAGGGGRSGGVGGDGAASPARDPCNDGGGGGGTGGNGGTGGSGGGGAGGNGGPAVGLAQTNGSNVKVDTATLFYLGVGGAGGGGGTGAGPNTGGKCTAPNGQTGNTGLAANQRTY